MNKKWMISGLCGSMLLFGASLYGFAQGKIANPPGEKILFSLEPIPDKDWKKAKTVTSIPIDQLGKLKLRIYSGNKTFKELYGKFWGNLRSGLDLAAKFIPKGQTADFSDTKKWLTHYIAEAKEDSEWPDSNTLEIDLLKAAKGIKLWEISSDDDIAFAVQYTKEKKTGKTVWVNNGWVDIFRNLNPDKKDVYTYWDQKTRSRDRNVGWRIDYFFTNQSFMKNVKSFKTLTEYMGSDHCPIMLDIIL